MEATTGHRKVQNQGRQMYTNDRKIHKEKDRYKQSGVHAQEDKNIYRQTAG